MDNLCAPKASLDVLYDFMDITKKHEWISDSYKELVSLWNLCDLREQQELLKDLILKIEVLNSKEEKKAYAYINAFIQKNKLTPASTLIVGCGDVGRAIDGSLVGLQRMKNILEPVGDWEPRMSQNMIELMDKVKDNDTIIIFDDFIGSGDKIIKKFNWLQDLIIKSKSIDSTSITVHFISLAAMNFGKERIENVTQCEVSAYMILKKGISDHYSANDVHEKIMLMTSLEYKLSDCFKDRDIADYTLGYSKSESLYFAENDNCPNNVFPIFWWQKLKSGDEHGTLLQRSK